MSTNELAAFISIQVLTVLILILNFIPVEPYRVYVQLFLLGFQVCCLVYLICLED